MSSSRRVLGVFDGAEQRRRVAGLRELLHAEADLCWSRRSLTGVEWDRGRVQSILFADARIISCNSDSIAEDEDICFKLRITGENTEIILDDNSE